MNRCIFVSKRKLQFCQRKSAKQTGRMKNVARSVETGGFSVKGERRRKEMCDVYGQLCPAFKEYLTEKARKLRDVRP